MSAQKFFERSLRLNKILTELFSAGASISVGTDFLEYKHIRATVRDTPQYPMFDVSQSYVDHTNGFWIVGTATDGTILHTQAMRFLTLGEDSIVSHLNTHRHKYITPDGKISMDDASFKGDGKLNTLCGNVCYHGDFWFKSGPEGLRGGSYTTLLGALAFELAELTWKPECIFGLVPLPVAKAGVGVRYGYKHWEAGSWIDKKSSLRTDEAVVWMSKSDLESYLPKANEWGIDAREENTGEHLHVIK